MDTNAQTAWIAFAKNRRIARGAPRAVAAKVKQATDARQDAEILVFDANSSALVEIDLRGSLAAVLKRIPTPPSDAAPSNDEAAAEPTRGVGRPKLGVMAREVTLLPRHWEWLASQPGGASVALRKLVEYGMRANREADRLRVAQESAYRFMQTMAGNNPGFEDATRALFAGHRAHVQQAIAQWPRDVRDHAAELCAAAMPQQ